MAVFALGPKMTRVATDQMSLYFLMLTSTVGFQLAEWTHSCPSHHLSSGCTCTACCRRWDRFHLCSHGQTTARLAAAHRTPSQRHHHSTTGGRREGWQKRNRWEIRLSTMRDVERWKSDPHSSWLVTVLTMQLSVFAWPAHTMNGLQNRYSGNEFIQVRSSTTGTVIHFR